LGEFVFQPTYEWMKAKWLELANCPYCSSLLGQDIALRYYTCSYCGCGELALIHDHGTMAETYCVDCQGLKTIYRSQLRE